MPLFVIFAVPHTVLGTYLKPQRVLPIANGQRPSDPQIAARQRDLDQLVKRITQVVVPIPIMNLGGRYVSRTSVSNCFHLQVFCSRTETAYDRETAIRDSALHLKHSKRICCKQFKKCLQRRVLSKSGGQTPNDAMWSLTSGPL